MKANHTKSNPFIENLKGTERPFADDYYESAKTLCARLDICTNTFLKLVATYGIKPHWLPGIRSKRYSVKEVLSLIKDGGST